jgi:hypothetical protein
MTEEAFQRKAVSSDSTHAPVTTPPATLRRKSSSKAKATQDEAGPDSKTDGACKRGTVEHWAEVYSRKQHRWVCIDTAFRAFDSPAQLEKLLPGPLRYAVGMDEQGRATDVTARCVVLLNSAVKMLAHSQGTR